MIQGCSNVIAHKHSQLSSTNSHKHLTVSQPAVLRVYIGVPPDRREPTIVQDIRNDRGVQVRPPEAAGCWHKVNGSDSCSALAGAEAHHRIPGCKHAVVAGIAEARHMRVGLASMSRTIAIALSRCQQSCPVHDLQAPLTISMTATLRGRLGLAVSMRLSGVPSRVLSWRRRIGGSALLSRRWGV